MDEKKLIEDFFGTRYKPSIDISLADVPKAAQIMAGKISISGMQPKLSVILNKKLKKLEIVGQNGEYILKPQVQIFQDMPQNEFACMSIAKTLGIEVAPFAQIKLMDGSYAFITKRYDRVGGRKLHQESFFQILGKTDKYSGSYEEIGKRLKEISSVPGLDMQLLYERAVLFFLLGNGDAHMKNFSILYKDDQIRLAPAYDIVCSKLFIPDEEESALTIQGKKNNIKRSDFIKLAEYLNIPAKIAAYFFKDKISSILELIDNSSMNLSEKKEFKKIVIKRFGVFEDIV